MSEPLRILVVCTANICRSPAAEAYLRLHAAERELDIDVSSSGFLFDDEPASSTMASVMGERDIDLGAHRSRVTQAAMVEDADLVVTMERRHARDLATAVGPRHVFTLKGAVEALAAIDTSIVGPRARLDAADEAREHGDLLGDGPDEVADPHGRSARVNRKTADELRDLTAALLDALYPTPT